MEAATASAQREVLPEILAELERIRAAAWLPLVVSPHAARAEDRLPGRDRAGGRHCRLRGRRYKR